MEAPVSQEQEPPPRSSVIAASTRDGDDQRRPLGVALGPRHPLQVFPKFALSLRNMYYYEERHLKHLTYAVSQVSILLPNILMPSTTMAPIVELISTASVPPSIPTSSSVMPGQGAHAG